jgi:hypothetical protein
VHHRCPCAGNPARRTDVGLSRWCKPERLGLSDRQCLLGARLSGSDGVDPDRLEEVKDVMAQDLQRSGLHPACADGVGRPRRSPQTWRGLRNPSVQSLVCHPLHEKIGRGEQVVMLAAYWSNASAWLAPDYEPTSLTVGGADEDSAQLVHPTVLRGLRRRVAVRPAGQDCGPGNADRCWWGTHEPCGRAGSSAVSIVDGVGA